MKTAEEIEQLSNKLYPDVSFKKDVESEDTFRTNEIRRIERLAFYEGYKYGHDDGYEEGYSDRVKSRTEKIEPCRCPVCDGKGFVPSSFYSVYGNATTGITEICRTCKGQGIIWNINK